MWWRAARESSESRDQRSGPDQHASAQKEEQQSDDRRGDPSQRVRSRRCRAPLRAEARRAVPDAVPLRRAFLAQRLAARHAEGERLPLRGLRATLRCRRCHRLKLGSLVQPAPSDTEGALTERMHSATVAPPMTTASSFCAYYYYFFT